MEFFQKKNSSLLQLFEMLDTSNKGYVNTEDLKELMKGNYTEKQY